MTERMYADLAEWWPLLSPPEEYKEEAALYREAIGQFAAVQPRTMLELGSGGGHVASHFKHWFELTLVDLSPNMLAVSRALNPELPHHEGDMRDVRLGQTFDAVFIHDAICHMTTREDLRRAMSTAFEHCAPGGIALFAPDMTKETFVPTTDCGGSDQGQRGFRYLQWLWDPNPNDETCQTDFAFLIRNEDGSISHANDRHIYGLFPRQVWLDSMAAAGFAPKSKIYDHPELPKGYELFVGVKG